MNQKKTIILDSSPFLPRVTRTHDSLIEGMHLLNPEIVILPSIDFSWNRTADIDREFVQQYSRDLPDTVGMLQGTNLDSLQRSYNSLRGLCDIIGLASPLEKIARRAEIVRDLEITEPVLYLEIYLNPMEEIPPIGSVGICTSYPLRLAADLRKLEEYYPTPKPLNFYLPEGKLITQFADDNTRDYLNLFKGGNLG
jgi:hypothetical protein